MKTTGNLGLKKPDGTDIVDITDLNGNMDILDTAVKAVQDHAADTFKHITAAERTAWNAKASMATATASAAGLMAGADKSKLDSVAQGANNYVHPSTHLPSIIVQDAANRFVSDTEKAAWNGKANLSTTPQQTTADLTYYVRTDGNDGNTGLGNTAGGAFRTIGKAISMIPQVVNHAAVVNVAAGTYNEVVNIAGRSGSSIIQINGDSIISNSRSVHSFSIINCSCRVEVNGFNGFRTDGEAFSTKASTQVLFYRDSVSSSSPSSVGYFVESSSVYLNECLSSNRLVGVYAHVNGQIFASGIAGTGCKIGYQASVNGKITVQNSTLTAVGNLTDTVFGGTIHTLGGVVNPWGDNTQDMRPIVWGGSLVSSTTTTASAWNLLRYGISTNQQGGYNATTGVFTSPQTGWYKIKATVQLQSAPIGAYSIAVLQNGVNRWIADYKNTAVTSHLFLGGDMCLHMPAGNTIAIQLHTDANSVIIVNGMDTTHLEIVRIA
ncbi:hypothetical protein KDC22_29365 [Paenibacillus tritici]|uniref:hypothetical protein n=1 Tax=Paenibacillus tritici TaxID=1873425 RepID=UPI001BAB17DB|nr:hypothetical protein [Paenibacillus tritici]QUL54366.1 hypothetical protein KDC22_29365 [Paenibacillus tritici]